MTLQLTNLKKFKLQTASKQELMRGSVISDKMVAAYLNYHEVRQIVDVAKTIMARDFKGFSSGFDSTNGVIEWK